MSRRLERVTELLHQEISKRIPRLKEPGLGFVTITGVRLSPDFLQAKVYFSVLGTLRERGDTQEALERSIPALRNELRRLENLRHPPMLTFIYDNTIEETQKVFDVLNRLEAERQPVPLPPTRKKRKSPRA